jgi:tetratricopeptide (TPR) repeat protein
MGAIMQKIIISILLILTFICSCSKINEKPEDLINEANLLWDGKQYTNPKKAIEYLDKAIKLQPNFAETYNQRGAAYKNLGQNQLAIDDFTKAIRLQPDYVLAYYNRGTVYNNISKLLMI